VQRSRRMVLVVLLVSGIAGLGLLLIDYLGTRSDARLAVLLARLGPETPLESYDAEFGPPIHHFTSPDEMKEWGPLTDEALLARTELYYFGYWGLPHRFVTVYSDKNTRRCVAVTWKSM
jgi:hypothetical protein